MRIMQAGLSPQCMSRQFSYEKSSIRNDCHCKDGSLLPIPKKQAMSNHGVREAAYTYIGRALG